MLSIPENIIQRVASITKTERLLLVIPNPGLATVLCRYLDRWGPEYDCGPTLELAISTAFEKDEATRAKGRTPKAVSIVIADIDRGLPLPEWLVNRSSIRFLLLCSDAHRRAEAKTVTQHWYSACQSFVLLNKPVKREALFDALVQTPRPSLPPPSDSVNRTMSTFTSAADHPAATAANPVSASNAVHLPMPPKAASSGVISNMGAAPETLMSAAAPQESAPAALANTGTSSSSSRLQQLGSLPRILMAEDSPINVTIALRFIAWAGLKCEVVNDGQQCVNAARTALAANTPYDLILMDCQMPNMDGFEAARQIRALELELGFPRVPMIAMTAFVMPEDHDKCLASGMDSFISKPFSKEGLREMIFRFLPRNLNQSEI